LRQHLARILTGLAITLFFVGHAAEAYRVGLIEQLDRSIYDARLRMTMPGKGDPRVVILDIDEKSLGEIGRWPWSRSIMARLVDRLFDEHGVAVLGFDVVWAERDNSSGMPVLDALAQKQLKDVPGFQSAYRELRATLDYDAMFAASLGNRPVVLGYYLSSESQATRVNAIPVPVLPKGEFQGRVAPLYRWNGYTGNLQELMANAAGAGHINPLVDDDGVVRQAPLLVELDGSYYEAFSLAIVRRWLALEAADRQAPAIRPGFPSQGTTGMEWLAVGRLAIPVNERATALIPYAGMRSSFAYFSLADVIQGRIEPGALKDKIALIGTSVPTLSDLKATAVQNVYPGVEIHANLIAGMINQQVKRQPRYMTGAEVLLLLVGGIVLSLLIPRLPAIWATLVALAGVGIVSLFGFLVWTEGDTVLPLAASILMAAAIYTMNMAYGYFVETRSKRQIAERFGQYVPPEVVDRIAADPGAYSMQPRAAELTILFADVRGFTGISETLQPEELREYIDAYLTAMSGIIREKHRGTLDKYIGDAVMAFWGAPVEDPQHARNGVLAGLQMLKECEVLNGGFAARNWPPLRIGVGLNTGSVRVGDMGSRVRRAYTAMGDAVNVASRLEGRTKHYGVGILAGEATRNAVKDVVFREVDRIRVKGKDRALTVYEPLGLEGEVDARVREEMALWDQALRAYRAQQWDQADAHLAKLQRMNPACGLYAKFSERVADLRREPPPPGWDGVTSFDEK
jgi:adenylate cyclase